jgi:ABC-type oligopeptide transport system substrate-binding subunit
MIAGFENAEIVKRTALTMEYEWEGCKAGWIADSQNRSSLRFFHGNPDRMNFANFANGEMRV